MSDIVADAGPIISAARARRLDLLAAVVRRLIVPPAVYDEVVRKGAGRAGADAVALAAWVAVRSTGDPGLALLLPIALGSGEREAIVLAEELGCALLADDPGARAAAKRRGVPVFGTLRVLAEAKRRALVGAVRPALDDYLQSGFRLSGDLCRAFLAEMGES